MVILHGTDTYGQVDTVPGVFHVTTRFWHFFFIPVIPLRAELHYKSGRIKEARRVPFSAKSILVTWLRTLCTLAAITLAILAFVASAQRGGAPKAVAYGICAALAAGLGLASLKVRLIAAPPTYDRAMQLATSAGAGADVFERLRQAYGKDKDYSAEHGFPVIPVTPGAPTADNEHATPGART